MLKKTIQEEKRSGNADRLASRLWALPRISKKPAFNLFLGCLVKLWIVCVQEYLKKKKTKENNPHPQKKTTPSKNRYQSEYSELMELFYSIN